MQFIVARILTKEIDFKFSSALENDLVIVQRSHWHHFQIQSMPPLWHGFRPVMNQLPYMQKFTCTV